jgi:hypothetical protein
MAVNRRSTENARVKRKKDERTNNIPKNDTHKKGALTS